MLKQIPIIDLDSLRGKEDIIVQYDTIIPEFHMRHVLDLASIVGNYNVPREAFITEYTPELIPILF